MLYRGQQDLRVRYSVNIVPETHAWYCPVAPRTVQETSNYRYSRAVVQYSGAVEVEPEALPHNAVLFLYPYCTFTTRYEYLYCRTVHRTAVKIRDLRYRKAPTAGLILTNIILPKSTK
jgi:hypothetical protein